jgi:phosphatidylglycerophosphatase A
MSNKPDWRRFIPHFHIPPLPRMSGKQKLALAIGTGLGSGFLKPFGPTWGSIPGFLGFVSASQLPAPIALATSGALLIAAVWSGTICERLLGGKDPRPVVIDEIAAVPFALWPLWFHWPVHALSWVILFGVYRIADYLKPWPANRMQAVRGGLGILIDDVISSTYMGIALFAFIRFFPACL